MSTTTITELSHFIVCLEERIFWMKNNLSPALHSRSIHELEVVLKGLRLITEVKHGK
jgi:hypothetical protein